MDQKRPISQHMRQSPPIDFTVPYSDAWLAGKTILITGGASGFGAAFVQRWAAAGATLIVGDINTQKGDSLVRELRQTTKNKNLHFVHCDVTDWQSQVNLFKEAIKLSPHGGIDVVVANAGIAGPEPIGVQGGLDAAEPEKPNFRVLEVNLVGVLYTTHLALFWLPKNPGSKDCSPDSKPDGGKGGRDRHLLLIGSVASLMPIPGQPLYGSAKHGVLGLFRTIRASSFVTGVRVNIVCPYFIDTPIINTVGRMVLAGSGMGEVEDVVDAATRLSADTRILGRGLVVGPKMKVRQQEDGGWVIVKKDEVGETRAIWEAYADDFEDSETFLHNIIMLLRGLSIARGWAGWVGDIFGAIGYGIKSYWR